MSIFVATGGIYKECLIKCYNTIAKNLVDKFTKCLHNAYLPHLIASGHLIYTVDYFPGL